MGLGARVRTVPQVFFLFLFATGVAIGLIYLINLEAAARYGEGDLGHKKLQPNPAFLVQDEATSLSPTSASSSSVIHTLAAEVRTGFATFFRNFKAGLYKLSHEEPTSSSRRTKRAVVLEIEDKEPPHRLRHEHVRKSAISSTRRHRDHDPPPVIIEPSISSQKECYHTDDVLIVVAITCVLNFSFVMVVWCSVRWVNKKRRKRMRVKRRRKWESESSSTSGTESDDEQDNRIVKSYSMEDLRFYYG